MKQQNKFPTKVLLLIFVSSVLLLPFVSNASAFFSSGGDEPTPVTVNAILQVRTRDKTGFWAIASIAIYARVETYDTTKILSCESGIFFKRSFIPIPFVGGYHVYDILDIEHYEEYLPSTNILYRVGCNWTFKLRERYNPNVYVIFEMSAGVRMGGVREFDFRLIDGANNEWRHYVEAIDWDEHVTDLIAEELGRFI